MQTNDIKAIVRQAVKQFQASQAGREIDSDDYLDPIADVIRTWEWNRQDVADVRVAILSLPYGADTELLHSAFPDIVGKFHETVPVQLRNRAEYLDGDRINRMQILAIDYSNRALVSRMYGDEADTYQMVVMSLDEAVVELAGYLRGGNFGSELDDPEVRLHLREEAGDGADVPNQPNESKGIAMATKVLQIWQAACGSWSGWIVHDGDPGYPAEHCTSAPDVEQFLRELGAEFDSVELLSEAPIGEFTPPHKVGPQGQSIVHATRYTLNVLQLWITGKIGWCDVIYCYKTRPIYVAGKGGYHQVDPTWSPAGDA